MYNNLEIDKTETYSLICSLRSIFMILERYHKKKYEKRKKRNAYINDVICWVAGEAKYMFYPTIKNKNIQKPFGQLELVDRELFFISANRRDT